MTNLKLNFRHHINGENLIIAIAQDHETLEVLMVAYMNSDAFKKTLQTGKAHYWSTSRNQLWLKGESSGHIQYVEDILTDCDKDAVLLKVKQEVAACHEGYFSCFYRQINGDDEGEGFKLKIIKEKIFDPEKIYGEK